MPRTKKISTEELCRFADEYCVKNVGTKITIPALGRFIRECGYDVADYLIRRDNAVREHLEEYNQALVKESASLTIVYHGLDIESFLERNSTKNQLKGALATRDNYYATIAGKAAIILKRNQELERESEILRGKNKQLCNELEKKQGEHRLDRNVSVALKEKDDTIKKLRDIIYDRVYPETANLLLEKEGVFDAVNKIVAPESLVKRQISADTDVTLLRYDSVKELLEGCDE